MLYAVLPGSPERPTTAHVCASSSIRSMVAGSCQSLLTEVCEVVMTTR